MDVARQRVELGHRDRAVHRAGLGERRRQLRPAVERVAAFASLDLDEFRDDLVTLAVCEPRQRFPLRFDP